MNWYYKFDGRQLAESIEQVKECLVNNIPIERFRANVHFSVKGSIESF